MGFRCMAPGSPAGRGVLTRFEHGSSVIVTGGTGGLGAAVTRAFLDAGDASSCPGWPSASSSASRSTSASSSSRPTSWSPASAAEVVAAAGDDLRAVVNLVGGFAAGDRVHETPVEEFEAQLRLNLRPTYLMCAAAIPGCSRRAAAPSSACPRARHCGRSRAPPATSPARRPCSPSSTRCTPSTATTGSASTRSCPRRSTRRPTARRCPTPTTRRWVKPEEIARVVRVLCSDDTAVVGGGHVPVYGRA